MKKKTKSVQVSSPFDLSVHKTERSAVAVLMTWMREIIEKEQLDLGLPDVETSARDKKMPDAVIYESRGSDRVLCLIEAKPPYFDVFDEKDLKEPACKKATHRQAKYFATTNFKYLIWFSTERVNSAAPEEEQVKDKYKLSELDDLDLMEETRYKESIKKELTRFLKKLYAVYSGQEAEPKQAIDEFLIFRLQEKIHTLAKYYRIIIEDQCNKNEQFVKDLKKWFVEQGWSFAWESHNYETAARQTAYLLVNKILFYDLLQAKRPEALPAMEIPESHVHAGFIGRWVQAYFTEVLKIDYETIFATDFIDKVAFPDERPVGKEIKILVNLLRKYDFSKLGFDIIGRIFERLIPPEERHYLGQYFTNPDIVDIILKFCLHHEDDKIFDPACGAGTFLVRAYQHKRLMNQFKSHEEILETLWGNDIAKFPAHLAMINLAINDLGVDKNYPNIIHEDFFSFLVRSDGFELPEKWRKSRAKTLGTENREVEYPRRFNAIVGNPPYTRQEEINQISPAESEYKSGLYQRALLDINGNSALAEIGKRAGIHTYFFVHGTKFLIDGGYFGFIVSNSWLDADYGKGLQEFFLRNYKIIAIIESKIERWFEEADVNTCIVILQRCKDQNERNQHFARFVHLKKPLRYFIPAAQDMWEKQIERFEAIDKLIKTICAHTEFYENDDLQIHPKRQKDLSDEGFSSSENKYTGAKWGKYIRAPKIYFKILEKGKEKLVPLKEVADIRRGFTTGANEFFYLTEEQIKKRGIEEEFWMHRDKNENWIPNKIIVSPREGKNVVIALSDLSKIILSIKGPKSDIKGKSILTFIKNGERKEYNKRPTCSSRKNWYEISLRESWPILFPMIHNDRNAVFLNINGVQVDHNLFEIKTKNAKNNNAIFCFLFSTVSMLLREFAGRVNLGEGALKTEGIDIERLLVVNYFQPKVKQQLKRWLNNHMHIKVKSIFHELNAHCPEEVDLEKVDASRKSLDAIIMGSILGLSDSEQSEVYQAIIDAVKSRLTKSKSVINNKKTREGVNVSQLLQTIKAKLGENTLAKYYREQILLKKSLLEKELPKISGAVLVEKELFGWKVNTGKKTIDCRSEEEAKYCKIFIEAHCEIIKIPANEKYLEKVLPELEALKEQADKVIHFYLEAIVNLKLREQIAQRFWHEIMQ